MCHIAIVSYKQPAEVQQTICTKWKEAILKQQAPVSLLYLEPDVSQRPQTALFFTQAPCSF